MSPDRVAGTKARLICFPDGPALRSAHGQATQDILCIIRNKVSSILDDDGNDDRNEKE